MTSTRTPDRREAVGLCFECFQRVELSDCRLVDLQDGERPLLGHLRDGQLCGPVFDETHLGDDVDGLGVLECDGSGSHTS